jgi:hypothetical protein
MQGCSAEQLHPDCHSPPRSAAAAPSCRPPLGVQTQVSEDLSKPQRHAHDNPSCLILSLARRCRYCTSAAWMTSPLRRRAAQSPPQSCCGASTHPRDQRHSTADLAFPYVMPRDCVHAGIAAPAALRPGCRGCLLYRPNTPCVRNVRPCAVCQVLQRPDQRRVQQRRVCAEL